MNVSAISCIEFGTICVFQCPLGILKYIFYIEELVQFLDIDPYTYACTYVLVCNARSPAFNKSSQRKKEVRQVTWVNKTIVHTLTAYISCIKFSLRSVTITPLIKYSGNFILCLNLGCGHSWTKYFIIKKKIQTTYFQTPYLIFETFGSF